MSRHPSPIDRDDAELLRRLAGELPADRAAALDRRLAAEPELAARLGRLEVLWRGLEPPPADAVPPGFTAAVLAAARRRTPGDRPGEITWSRAPGWARAAGAAALAAGLALGVGLGLAGGAGAGWGEPAAAGRSGGAGEIAAAQDGWTSGAGVAGDGGLAEGYWEALGLAAGEDEPATGGAGGAGS